MIVSADGSGAISAAPRAFSLTFSVTQGDGAAEPPDRRLCAVRLVTSRRSWRALYAAKLRLRCRRS
jgi:hypothetical protein